MDDSSQVAARYRSSDAPDGTASPRSEGTTVEAHRTTGNAAAPLPYLWRGNAVRRNAVSCLLGQHIARADAPDCGEGPNTLASASGAGSARRNATTANGCRTRVETVRSTCVAYRT